MGDTTLDKNNFNDLTVESWKNNITRTKEEVLSDFRGVWCRLNKNIALREHTAFKVATNPNPSDKLKQDLDSLDTIIEHLEVELVFKYNDLVSIIISQFLADDNLQHISMRCLGNAARAVADATVVELSHRYINVSVNFNSPKKETTNG